MTKPIFELLDEDSIYELDINQLEYLKNKIEQRMEELEIENDSFENVSNDDNYSDEIYLSDDDY